MRYYIIFGVTIILAIFILFFDPYKDYLGVYKNSATLEYSQKEEGYEWVLISSNDNLIVKEENNNKWTIHINKVGETDIEANFINLDTNDVKYKINYKFNNNGKKLFWLDGMAKGLDDFINPY